MMLEVRLLGKFDVRHDGKPIIITSRPAQSLFAYLILNAGTSHRREKLAGMLWPDSLEETARENLRHALWRMRKALETASSTRFLHADDIAIGFKESSEYWLDASALEKLSENASADELIAVLSNYQGELLPGFYDEWVISEREHLNSIFEHQMARLMSLLQEEKRWLDILDWGERWIKLGQKPEPAYRALMTAHAAKGDMSKIAATFERCVKSLKELGIEPSEQTRELYENLKSGKEIPKTISMTTKLGAKQTFSTIPVPLTSFVGREKELKEIARLLSTSRLLTLTGPGGVGKTRLAIQTAHDSIKKYKDGVFWVSLVSLSDGNLIAQEIAQSLNVREAADERLIETLKTYLKSKDILLVIDNCEHLIRDCARYVEQLLAASLKLRILATSIEALGLFNENIWQVPSLPVPEIQQLSLQDIKDFASIELFYERASNAKTGFALDEKNAAPVAQICCRLDGIPLAIELAAARLKLLSVDEIAARLDDRFSLLTAGSRTAIPRHQTLRATIDWSYDLLTEAERILLRRLAVFAGGFTLEAAEAVCSREDLKRNEVLDLLGRLVDKSLVLVEADAELDETRYRLLETVRQYAVEKLAGIAGEPQAIRGRHSEFFVKWVEKAEPNIFGSDSALWFRRLSKELDNIRAAIEWSTYSGNAVAALWTLGALANFWFVFGLSVSLSEWHNRVQQALSRPEGLERTIARAKALNGIGFLYWVDKYTQDIRPELTEALTIAQELGDKENIAAALRNLGLFASVHGTYTEASSYLVQSLEIWRQMMPVDKMEIGRTLMFLGDAALTSNEIEQARSYYEESIAVWRYFGDLNLSAYSVRRLGLLAWRGGDYEKALRLCKESLMLNRETGDLRGMLASIAAFCTIATVQGNFKRAAMLMAAVESQLASTGTQLLPVDTMDLERSSATLRAQFDEKILSKFWARGKAMSLEQAMAFALEQDSI